jgi:hypothetical protein
MASLKAQDHENAYVERLAWEGRNRFANSIPTLFETYFGARVRLEPLCDVASRQGSIFPIKRWFIGNSPVREQGALYITAGLSW